MFSLICVWNKRLSKRSWGWWFETLSCPLWRHCNVTTKCYQYHTISKRVILCSDNLTIAHLNNNTNDKNKHQCSQNFFQLWQLSVHSSWYVKWKFPGECASKVAVDQPAFSTRHTTGCKQVFADEFMPKVNFCWICFFVLNWQLLTGSPFNDMD